MNPMNQLSGSDIKNQDSHILISFNPWHGAVSCPRFKFWINVPSTIPPLTLLHQLFTFFFTAACLYHTQWFRQLVFYIHILLFSLARNNYPNNFPIIHNAIKKKLFPLFQFYTLPRLPSPASQKYFDTSRKV